jgi:hypothetical protein
MGHLLSARIATRKSARPGFRSCAVCLLGVDFERVGPAVRNSLVRMGPNRSHDVALAGVAVDAFEAAVGRFVAVRAASPEPLRAFVPLAEALWWATSADEGIRDRVLQLGIPQPTQLPPGRSGSSGSTLRPKPGRSSACPRHLRGGMTHGAGTPIADERTNRSPPRAADHSRTYSSSGHASPGGQGSGSPKNWSAVVGAETSTSVLSARLRCRPATQPLREARRPGSDAATGSSPLAARNTA